MKKKKRTNKEKIWDRSFWRDDVQSLAVTGLGDIGKAYMTQQLHNNEAWEN